ncbi:unnamed protein product [Peniophora sp. CBMAI 1063]|nr:unnamed protein product [Peniophora sp. CBMAI 1063]
MRLLILSLELLLAPFGVLLVALIFNVIRGTLSRLAKHAMLRAVPGPPRKSFLTGDLHDLYGVDGLPHLEALSLYGGIAKVHGLFGDVLLTVSDPRALAHILVNDVQKFPALDVSGTYDMHRYLMGPGLLATNGSAHRRQRKILNPAFSISQIRGLAPLMREISVQLRDLIIDDVTSGVQVGSQESKLQEIDIAEWLGRAALDFVGRCGFGHDFHALQGDADTYVHAVKDMIPTIASLGSMITLFVVSGGSRLPPRLLRFMGQTASIISPSLSHLMHIVDSMWGEMDAIWQAHKATHKEGREDMQAVLLDVLLDAKEGSVSDSEAIGQCTTLVMAGAETTSTALCRILLLLSEHVSVQDRLRKEITQALSEEGEDGNGLGYDALMALPLLDAVCKETLRVFAPAPLRNRRCIAESVVPFADGSTVHIPAGTEVLINIHGVNTNKDIWGADAKVWRPERWLEPLPQSVADANMPGLYANMLTFLAGPKGCIGLNFSLLEMKTVLATLIPLLEFRSPTELEIKWRFGQTVTPSVKGDKGLNPRMPLQIQVI